jgi:hypothetical protein
MNSQEFLDEMLAETNALAFEPANTRPLTIPREPLEDCEGGFKYQFTVLGSADRNRGRAYAADYLNMMPTAGYQGAIDGVHFHAPTVTIGSASFADLVAHGRSPNDLHLLAIETGKNSAWSVARVEAALCAVTRHAPDLYIIEDLTDHGIPTDLLRTLWHSGFHFAGCIHAQNPHDMFPVILEGLSIPDSDLEWLIDKRRPQIQVLFEGQRITDQFVEWVKANF